MKPPPKPPDRIPYVICVCGKRGYYSRKEAKKEQRHNSWHGMTSYRCERSEVALWHLGHLPGPVKKGRWDRRTLGPSAPRTPGRRPVSPVEQNPFPVDPPLSGG